MLRRPLAARFNQAVLDGRKTTTIRSAAWPIEKPIMLFNWSGAAYRSKQIDIAPIIVSSVQIVEIQRGEYMHFWLDGRLVWSDRPLYISEGFDSQSDMDAWFSRIVKYGEFLRQHLMTFSIAV